MQDSLPAAGPALPGGIGYPQGSCERFHGCDDSPFPSFLARCQTLFLVLTCRLWCGGWCQTLWRMVSDFVLGSYVPSSKPRTMSDTRCRSKTRGYWALQSKALVSTF